MTLRTVVKGNIGVMNLIDLPQYIFNSVIRQWAEGRTGGGPVCPWPGCGARDSQTLEHEDKVRQCRKCGGGFGIRVTRDGIQSYEVAKIHRASQRGDNGVDQQANKET